MFTREKNIWIGLAIGVVILGVGALGYRTLRSSISAVHSNENFAARCMSPEAMGAGSHAGMAWVPAGSFNMGDTVYPDEGPVRRVHVDGFWIDRHEVTNRDFAEFVKATGYVTVAERPVDPKTHPGLPPEMLNPGGMVFVMPRSNISAMDIRQWWHYMPGANWRHPGGPGTSIDGRDNYPVVQVAYVDAQAYARWKGRALPTERQWEWAARAGDKPLPDHERPKNANTWQGIFPIQNSADDGFTGLAPVGCYAPNKFGLYDMIGNVWEWTADIYHPHSGEIFGPDAVPSSNQDGDDSTIARYVIKGGSFLCASNYCMRYRPGAREPQEVDLSTSHLGFRTVIVPDANSSQN